MSGDYFTCWMVWGSNPGRDKRFFCSPKLPDPFWDHATFYLRGTVSFQGLRGLGCEVSHCYPSNYEVKVEVYLCSSSMPS